MYTNTSSTVGDQGSSQPSSSGGRSASSSSGGGVDGSGSGDAAATTVADMLRAQGIQLPLAATRQLPIEMVAAAAAAAVAVGSPIPPLDSSTQSPPAFSHHSPPPASTSPEHGVLNFLANPHGALAARQAPAGSEPSDATQEFVQRFQQLPTMQQQVDKQHLENMLEQFQISSPTASGPPAIGNLGPQPLVPATGMPQEGYTLQDYHDIARQIQLVKEQQAAQAAATAFNFRDPPAGIDAPALRDLLRHVSTHTAAPSMQSSARQHTTNLFPTGPGAPPALGSSNNDIMLKQEIIDNRPGTEPPAAAVAATPVATASSLSAMNPTGSPTSAQSRKRRQDHRSPPEGEHATSSSSSTVASVGVSSTTSAQSPLAGHVVPRPKSKQKRRKKRGGGAFTVDEAAAGGGGGGGGECALLVRSVRDRSMTCICGFLGAS